MRYAILHLSDIHLKSSKNPLEKRISKITEAIKSELKNCNNLAIIISGDVAYSGNNQEYNEARKHLLTLQRDIMSLGFTNYAFVTVPGNHDCLFDKSKDVNRKIIIERFTQKGFGELNEDLINICCEPQSNYFSFEKDVRKNVEALKETLLLNIFQHEIDGRKIIFTCYNTSWCSQLHEEQGKLGFPIKYFPDAFGQAGDIVISLIHHPLNWYEPTIAREFKTHLEKTSDLVLSGHEHEKSFSLKSNFDENFTYSIESSALQDSNNDDISGFNLIQIDLFEKQIKLANFSWKGFRYELAEQVDWVPFKKSPSLEFHDYLNTEKFSAFLNEVGTSFLHNRVDEIKLDDIFISPDLKKLNFDRDLKVKLGEIKNSKEIFRPSIGNGTKSIIIGDEGSGKTALCKFIYKTYSKSGYVPIFIYGYEFNSVNLESINKIIHEAYKNQYKLNTRGQFENIPSDKLLLIIDDYQNIKFNSEGKSRIIQLLDENYENIVITGNSLVHFQPYLKKKKNVVNPFEKFDEYFLQEFGSNLRYKLAAQWSRLGLELDIEKNELLRRIDYAVNNIQTIIGKSYIPSYPLYLLTLLQSLDSGINLKKEYSLHGFYYELLISTRLSKAVKDKDDISLYLTLMTEYAYFLFNEKLKMSPIAKTSFEKFYLKHAERYNLTYPFEKALNTLIEAKFLKIEDENIVITYKYIYYFFIAKYLTDSLNNYKTLEIVDTLFNKIHLEEYSTILTFMTHLSKEKILYDKLLETARKQFSKSEIAKLEDDVISLNTLITEIPEQVMELVDVEEEREKEMEENAKLEQQMEDTEEIKETKDEEKDFEELDMLGKLIVSIKTVDLLGQITKKQWGSLLGEEKLNLATETYFLGLRTLGYYLTELSNDKDALAEYLRNLIGKRHIREREDMEQFSKNFVFKLAFMMSYGMIKRISNSIGYDKLAPTFRQIVELHPVSSVKLVDIAIKLDHHNSIPFDDIDKLKEGNKAGNHLVNLVVKNLVITYCYMFDTSFETKQRISSKLGIKIQNQMTIDAVSTVKKKKNPAIRSLPPSNRAKPTTD